MFNNIISEYINLSENDFASKIIFDTKNSYEFTMTAVSLGGKWYTLVENPDQSRIADIDKVIAEEFGAKTTGWCVLKRYHKKIGESIAFDTGDTQRAAITLEDGDSFFWLLTIRPEPNSRLANSRKS